MPTVSSTEPAQPGAQPRRVEAFVGLALGEFVDPIEMARISVPFVRRMGRSTDG